MKPKFHIVELREAWDTQPDWTEIRHRLHDPGLYDRCRRVEIATGVGGVYCHKSGGDANAWEMQALRFDKQNFNMDQAKAWVDKHPDLKGSYAGEGQDCGPDRELSDSLEMIEAVTIKEPDPTGSAWEAVILAFGRSKRGWVYTPQSVRGSLANFEGAPVYANSIADDHGHTKAANKVPRDKVGIITDAKVTESDVRGVLNILPSASWLKDNLKFAVEHKLPMPYELSIHAQGKAYRGTWDGQENVPIVESFDRVDVDIVERAAAGGKIVRLVASDNSYPEGVSAMKQKLLALFTLFYPTFLESKKVDLPSVTENELWTHLMEADRPQSRFSLTDGAALKESTVDDMIAKATKPPVPIQEPHRPPKANPGGPDPLNVDNLPPQLKESIETQARELQILKAANCVQMLESQLSSSKLPKVWQDHIREQYKNRTFEVKDLVASIDAIRKTYSLFTGGQVDNQGMDIHGGQDALDKKKTGLLGLFMLDPNRPNPDRDVKEIKESLGKIPPYRSIKEAYIDFTGDTQVSGLKNDHMRFSESLATTDWASIMAATMNRRMVRDYSQLGLDTWRTFADVVPVGNFKQQERVRFGGYANLPIRAQRAPYAALTSPTDEKAIYTPQTRGGTEDLSREMIINDDVGSVTKIPQRLARAAAQTIHEFVYDFIKPSVNPTIYDGVALYHSNHLNTGTAALDAAGLKAARLRMKKYINKDNSKRLGIRCRYIAVPSELEDVAYGLVTPAFGQNNAVPTLLQTIGVFPIVVDYWTDATDWVLIADRADVVGLEVGFLNGQETPELFVSDMPNVGAWFTNDVLTYKIRHEYGAAIIDWRGFDGEIVAG